MRQCHTISEGSGTYPRIHGLCNVLNVAARIKQKRPTSVERFFFKEKGRLCGGLGSIPLVNVARHEVVPIWGHDQ